MVRAAKTAFLVVLIRGQKRRVVTHRARKFQLVVIAAAKRCPGYTVVDSTPIGPGAGGSMFRSPPRIRRLSATECARMYARLTQSVFLLDE